jgi:hypothetical protein
MQHMDENGGLNTTAYVKGVFLLTEPHKAVQEHQRRAYCLMALLAVMESFDMDASPANKRTRPGMWKKDWNAHRQFHQSWVLKHPLLRFAADIGMYCKSCHELKANNILGKGVHVGPSMNIQTADYHYLKAIGPNSCRRILEAARGKSLMGKFAEGSRCRMEKGKAVLVRSTHYLVKSYTYVNQFSELCTLQRNNLVDIPFEYNNKQGCAELQLSIDVVYFNKLTLVLQVHVGRVQIHVLRPNRQVLPMLIGAHIPLLRARISLLRAQTSLNICIPI